MRTIAQNYKLPYYTLSPTYSICKSHGYLAGEHFTCPICKQKAEVYSRITGYYRPVQNWNEGKLQEYKDRITYDTGKSVLKKEPVSMRPVERVEAESQNESGEGLKKEAPAVSVCNQNLSKLPHSQRIFKGRGLSDH